MKKDETIKLLEELVEKLKEEKVQEDSKEQPRYVMMNVGVEHLEEDVVLVTHSNNPNGENFITLRELPTREQMNKIYRCQTYNGLVGFDRIMDIIECKVNWKETYKEIL